MWIPTMSQLLNIISIIFNFILALTLAKSRYIFSFQNVFCMTFFASQLLFSISQLQFLECAQMGYLSHFFEGCTHFALVVIALQGQLLPKQLSVLQNFLIGVAIAGARLLVQEMLNGGSPYVSTSSICALGETQNLLILLDATLKVAVTSGIVYSYVSRWRVPQYKSNKQEAEGSLSGFNATLSFCVMANLLTSFDALFSYGYLLSLLSYGGYAFSTTLFRSLNAALAPLIFLHFHRRIYLAVRETVYKPLAAVAKRIAAPKMNPFEMEQLYVEDAQPKKTARMNSVTGSSGSSSPKLKPTYSVDFNGASGVSRNISMNALLSLDKLSSVTKLDGCSVTHKQVSPQSSNNTSLANTSKHIGTNHYPSHEPSKGMSHEPPRRTASVPVTQPRSSILDKKPSHGNMFDSKDPSLEEANVPKRFAASKKLVLPF
jgi:hypothetical protein